MMKYVNMGNTGLMGSAIGFGCMRISGIEQSEIARLVHMAMERGINLFDHADLYGGGKCEEVFAKALGITPSVREKMIIQSKCGIRKGLYDFSKAYIRQSVDGILKRLQTDYLDILLLHRPDALMEPEEVAETLDILHTSGKVRRFGVSNSNASQLALLSKYLRQPLIIDQLQFGVGHTGMIDVGLNVNMKTPQSFDRDGGVLDYCRMAGITVQAWAPLSYGYFEGVILDSEKFPDLNQVLNRMAEEKHAAKAAVAIAWILRHPAKIQPMVGFTDEKQLNDMNGVAEIELSREEWYEIYLAAGNKLP